MPPSTLTITDHANPKDPIMSEAITQQKEPTQKISTLDSGEKVLVIQDRRGSKTVQTADVVRQRREQLAEQVATLEAELAKPAAEVADRARQSMQDRIDRLTASRSELDQPGKAEQLKAELDRRTNARLERLRSGMEQLDAHLAAMTAE